jgi:tetratricopeptide (TPR) repeat protein
MKQQLSGTPSAEALNELGVWFARQNSFACAARAFATSIERDSQQKDLPRVVFEFGAALYYSGDTATTVTALQQAESLGYRNVKLNVLLASALDAQHSTAGAIEEWRKALEFDPEAALELDALSSDLNMASMYQEAVDLLEQPRVRPHRTVNQFMNLAAALVQLGRSEEATTVLEDGWNTYPASAEVARQLATLLTCLHRDAQAAMVLRLAAEEQAGIAN